MPYIPPFFSLFFEVKNAYFFNVDPKSGFQNLSISDYRKKCFFEITKKSATHEFQGILFSEYGFHNLLEGAVKCNLLIFL